MFWINCTMRDISIVLKFGGIMYYVTCEKLNREFALKVLLFWHILNYFGSCPNSVVFWLH